MNSSGSVQRGGARITVLIPCYEDGALLRQTLSSIHEQEPLDIMVIDDGSEDALTRATLRSVEADGVAVIRLAANSGVAAARNAGLRVARTPFVFPLDADDLAAAGMLGRMADVLEMRPDAVVCFGDYVEFGDAEILRAVPDELDPYRIAFTNEYPVSALFRRATLERYGGWPDSAYEDWDLWMTLAEHGETGVHLGPGLATYRRRIHGGRMLANAKRTHTALYAQLRADHPRLFGELGDHRRRSRLSPIRKLLSPFVYGGRGRRPWEPRVKAILDRSGVWTMRR